MFKRNTSLYNPESNKIRNSAKKQALEGIRTNNRRYWDAQIMVVLGENMAVRLHDVAMMKHIRGIVD